MEQEWSDNKKSVAYHEAGHRVMASIVKAPPKNISLLWNTTEKTWHGEVSAFQRSEIDGQSLIRIAYAGPWAEIKYQGRLRLAPDAIFDELHTPADLVKHAQNPAQVDTSADFHVKFIISNETQSLFIDLNAFSYDAEWAFTLAKEDKDLIENLLIQTRNQLNECPVWSAVEALANELLNRLGSNDSIVFDAEEAENMIRGILNQRAT